MKAVLRGKCIALNAHNRKEEEESRGDRVGEMVAVGVSRFGVEGAAQRKHL